MDLTQNARRDLYDCCSESSWCSNREEEFTLVLKLQRDRQNHEHTPREQTAGSRSGALGCFPLEALVKRQNNIKVQKQPPKGATGS